MTRILSALGLSLALAAPAFAQGPEPAPEPALQTVIAADTAASARGMFVPTVSLIMIMMASTGARGGGAQAVLPE